jgi:hypothetical protein
LALTRRQADAQALAVLKPARQGIPLLLFGLRHPVGANTTVVQGGPVRGRRGVVIKRSLKPLGRKAWLFWEDRLPNTFFEHPSELLLLDDRTGRVITKARFGWYPLVGAKLPAFLRGNGYFSSSYRIFSNLRTARAATGRRASSVDGSFPPVLSGFGFGYSPSVDPPLARPSAAGKLPAGAFKNDCLLIIGKQGPEPRFKGDFRALEEFAASVKLHTLQAKGKGEAPPDGKDLHRNVQEAIDKDKCKDILIFVHGHGEEGTGNVQVGSSDEEVTIKGETVTRTKEALVTPDDIKKILVDFNGKATFKLKIDSCFSGHFAKALPAADHPDLIVLETSTAADEEGKMWGTLVDRKRPDMIFPANPRAPDPRGKDQTPDEFMWANLTGWTKFINSQTEIDNATAAGGSLLGHMLKDGFTLGANADFARKNGVTHPQIEDNLPKPPPPPIKSAMGSLSNGNGNGSVLAYAIQTNTSANAFEIVLPSGLSINGSTIPSGFSCTESMNMMRCTNGSVQANTPLLGTFDHTGTIAANCACVQIAFSQDNGLTFFPTPPATLSGPPSSSPPPPAETATGTLTNGSGSILNYSIQTNTPANAFEIILPSSLFISGLTFPAGFSPANCTESMNMMRCTNGSVQPNTPLLGTFDHTGTIAANCVCVQIAFSQDNGLTFFPTPPATLSGPPSSSP